MPTMYRTGSEIIVRARHLPDGQVIELGVAPTPRGTFRAVAILGDEIIARGPMLPLEHRDQQLIAAARDAYWPRESDPYTEPDLPSHRLVGFERKRLALTLDEANALGAALERYRY